MGSNYLESLKGKKVLITGASGGIGSAIALLLSGFGASIGLHYHQDEEAVQATLAEIHSSGGSACLFQSNLLEAAGGDLVGRFVETYGGIDVLVNNAGAIFGFTPFEELSEADWDRTFALNAKAPFFLAKSAFPFMRERGGRILNISSISAKYGGGVCSLHYGAAKAALEAITVGLAKAGAPHGILVNTVRAGFIDTPFHRKLGRDKLEDRVRQIPLRKAGAPLDVARMVAHLASEAGDFITGEVFTVAGGD